MELVILEQMIPEDHLLRRIDRAIDFSFIGKLCEPLYCLDNGRPAVDPELLFRMIFIGYLYGVKSERRLEEEVNYNLAYKWFCELGVTEKAPDATTLSANRRRRFRDNNIAEQIFDEILRQAIEKGLVSGKVLYTDSTHVKAKANKHKKQTVTVEIPPKEYLKELDAAVDADRQALGKKPFDRDDDPPPSPTREIQQSRTDPDSGQLHKEGKPDGFHYSEHRTVDSRRNVIVNVRVTEANVNDVDPIPDILRDIHRRLGLLPDYIGPGRRIPQRQGSPPACEARNPRSAWIPPPHPQGRTLRQVPLHLRSRAKRLHLSGKAPSDPQNHQPGRPPGILQQPQGMRILSSAGTVSY